MVDRKSFGDADEAEALARGERLAPEVDDTEAVIGREAPEDEADEASVDDWQVAGSARPDLPDEDADGLDPLQESLRQAAEDGPPDRDAGSDR